MTRVRGVSGVIHFRNPADPHRCLCGAEAVSAIDQLFGVDVTECVETKDAVTCANCAKVYAAVKAEPWHSVDKRVMMVGCFETAQADGPATGFAANTVDAMLAAEKGVDA